MSVLLGIDLGTSALKLLVRQPDGRTIKAREAYESNDMEGWWAALCRAARRMDLSRVDVVGLSSQVGTYIVNDRRVIGWSAPEGLSELREVRERFSQEMFLNEISMPHPDIVSYPIPRLMHIARTERAISSVCMPKDLLVGELTGERISDVYSWRGLANLDSCAYSRFFLEWAGVDASALPPLMRPTEIAGRITAEAAAQTGLREGTPVAVGCNDFFAGLAGAGICREGDLFDITGTSEHIGGIADSVLQGEGTVSGPYFSGYVRYGVTGSSGVSLDFGRRLYPGCVDVSKFRRDAPLFLPYLNGERCPVCDPDASGVFFGIRGGCGGEALAYSVMEGVAFNLRRIFERLKLRGRRMVVAGGAAQDDTLNQLKADVLDMTLTVPEETDASALGAALAAGVAAGAFRDLADACAGCAGGFRVFEPSGEFDFSDRYAQHGRLYPALKESFHQWRRLEKQ